MPYPRTVVLYSPPLTHRLARYATTWAIALSMVWAAGHVWAQAQDLTAALNEQVVMVPKSAIIGSTELETTIYKPDGNGPFPVVVINHGKTYGDPRFQSRYRPAIAARYFMQRGYVVVVPMRQGFSKSSGNSISGGCNIESNGIAQAEDVKVVLDYMLTQPYVDGKRVVIAGQSHGGWTTLAFGTLNYPGVKGLINFAGGLRQEDCAGWQGSLARAAGAYAPKTSMPSVWFYGDNDSYFARSTWEDMLAKYNLNGSKARMVAFGSFGSDSHAMFGSNAGQPIWQPEITRFLAQIGMPNEPLAIYSRYAPLIKQAAPPKTDFAVITDAPPLAFLNENAKNGYKTFLTREVPRAFAVAPTGAWGMANSGDDPMRRALDNCSKFAPGQCRLYAVDNDIVWIQP